MSGKIKAYLLLSLIPLFTLFAYVNLVVRTPMGWDDVTVVNGIVHEVKPGGFRNLAGILSSLFLIQSIIQSTNLSFIFH